MLQMLSCMIHEHLQMLQILLHMLHKVPLVLWLILTGISHWKCPTRMQS